MHGEQSLRDLCLVVASNRGPVEHHLGPDNQLEARRASGGVVTALSAFRKYHDFSWIASAITPGDRHATRRATYCKETPMSGRVSFPATNAQTMAKDKSTHPVDLVVVPDDVFHNHYEVFSNRILWFLQHSMWDRLHDPKDKNTISKAWWSGYVPANEAFARTIAAKVRGQRRPVIMLQDYHLYLAPRFIRQSYPNAILQQFVHIPWPEPSVWQPLPLSLQREICRGLLANDIIGFQTLMSAHNFLQCCEHVLEDAEVDYAGKTVRFHQRTVHVRIYPISVDTDELRQTMAFPVVKQHKERLQQFSGEKTVVRVDRLGPSKNIARGFRAFEQLLQTHPDLQGKVKFLAFLVPSRTGISEYRQCYEEVMGLVQGINTRFGRDGFRPIEVFYENNYHQALAGMSLADVLLVNPLADGMNLVAKEGPIVNERDSVLILSRTAGAFEQLFTDVLSVEPMDVDGTALALANALVMTQGERNERARCIRAKIENQDLSRWVTSQLDDIGRALAERGKLSARQRKYKPFKDPTQVRSQEMSVSYRHLLTGESRKEKGAN